MPSLRPHILVVDDASETLALLELILSPTYHVSTATSGAQALAVLSTTEVDLIVLDVRMPGMDGFETCARIKAEANSSTPIIFISAVDQWQERVRGFEVGGVDYILKPVNDADVLARVRTHLELCSLRAELDRKNVALTAELKLARAMLATAQERARGPLVGESLVARRLRAVIAEVGPEDVPVHICAEHGSGAEGVARAIHQASPRALRRFIPMNGATNRRSKHAPGATDEDQVYLARGGSVFIDNIHVLPPEVLDKLIEAATNHDARLLVASPFAVDHLGPHEHVEGLRLPPLRQRRQDLAALVAHFCQRLSEEIGREIRGVDELTMEALREHDWPGNLDELHGVLERAAFHDSSALLHIDRGTLAPTRLGSYELVRRLGRGGMGEVWLANHRLLARPAAVKLMAARLAGQPSARSYRLFGQEAQATAELSSPHTVRVFDFGFAGDGTMYYVMELLDGLDLRQVLNSDGPLPPERVVAIALQICDSLEEAHDAGLVHRDIKPSNLFLARIGARYDFLKVLDFGVAGAISAIEHVNLLGPEALARDSAPPPNDSGIRGTPAYTAPEAISGRIDHRADIYSLGVTLFQLLTGRVPFLGENALETYVMHLNDAAPSASDIQAIAEVPGELAGLIASCLAKSPSDRPQSVAELRAGLESVPLTRSWTQASAAKWWGQVAADDRVGGTRQGVDGDDDRGAGLLTPSTLHGVFFPELSAKRQE